ncbi:MAG: LamG domain-containing protein [Candidatus Marinimicrobia bacterium]|nr:LamG domain-containing protein [Candidatus Neomarinimicrobiota bacterium]
MKKSNINLKRKINLNGKIIILFSLGLLLGLASGSGLIIVFGQERKEPLVVKKDNEATKSGEILGAVEFLSPTPSPLPTSTPTPTLTSTPVVTLSSQTSNPTDNSSVPPTPTPTISGVPLSPPSEKEELLIISDSLPEEWIVEKEEKIAFVSGKIGQALKVEKEGRLVLSGGEVFLNSGTISFWLKVEAAGGSEAPLLVWNFDGLNQPFSFEISFAEPQLLFSIYDETGNQEGVEFDLENPYSWHYAVATWDLTKEPYQRTLFIDGKKVVSGGFSFVPKICSQSLFQIGGIVGGRNPVSFLIDELVLTNWAKSEEEVVMPE